MEVSQNRGTPKSSIYRWVFHYKPSSYCCTPSVENFHFVFGDSPISVSDAASTNARAVPRL